MNSPPDGRTRHYSEFYGVTDVPDDRPVWIVLGNCQAEALRVMLDTALPERPIHTVRMPPVHELEARDVERLAALAGRASTLLAQPVRDDYRELPIGTNQVTAMLPAGARVIRFPVFRYSGLYPFQVIVRHPSAPAAVPPITPYHDLRTVLGAAGRAGWTTEVDRDALVENAARSVAELARRERRDTDVAISDLLVDPSPDIAHTINHPGNRVLRELATRVLAAAGLACTPADPGRVLLDAVHTPLDRDVIDALDLDAEPRPDWILGGERTAPEIVRDEHMRWYAEHPEFVDAALDRHRDLIALLFPGATA